MQATTKPPAGVKWLRGPIGALRRLLKRKSPHGRAREAVPASIRRSEALLHDLGELRRLLIVLLNARHTIPHLSRVEQTLARHGSPGLLNVPVPVLEKALEQLNAVADGFAGLSLIELRARLKAVINFQRLQRAGFKNTDGVDISEAAYSVFEELDRDGPSTLVLHQSRR